MPRPTATPQGVWCVDDNDVRERNSDSDQQMVSALTAYTPTHSFRRDLLAFCKIVNVIPHPKLLPLHPDHVENIGADHSTGNATISSANVYDVSDVEEVMVKNWRLDNDNCQGLCFALPFANKIHSVCLFNVQLEIEQLRLICQTIPKTQVQILQLEWNAAYDATPDSSKAIELDEGATIAEPTEVYAELLVESSPLTFLSLRANGITSAAAAAIATALRKNSTLQSLNLFQNRIKDDGALALAQALPYNKTLKSLSVANNELTGKGVKALVDAITKYVAPLELLKELEQAESRIHAEMDQAKKAKKKIDRHTAMVNLGLPILETIDGVQYAPGNATLEDLIVSGNRDIDEGDLLAINEALDGFQTKLRAHLRRIKCQRIPSVQKLHQHGHKLSMFLHT